MNIKRLVFLLLITILFTGCDITGIGATPTAISPTQTSTSSPSNTITPDVSTEPTDTVTPDVTSTPDPTATVTITPQATTAKPTAKPTTNPNIKKNKELISAYLPSLNTNLRFFGIAETGHYGKLSEGYSNEEDAMYEFNGTYDDGMGVPDKFKIKYFVDYERGTITEKAISNERLDKAEFHSKLHNIVILRFPLSLGSKWSHSTYINGKSYWVTAEVTECGGDKIEVKYTASDVLDYYDNTYIEIRTFEKDYGLTSFSNILSGDLDMTGVDTSDKDAVMAHIMNMHMFGYSLDKQQ